MRYTGYVALGVETGKALMVYTRQENQGPALPGDIRCGTWDTRKEAKKEAEEMLMRLQEDDLKRLP